MKIIIGFSGVLAIFFDLITIIHIFPILGYLTKRRNKKEEEELKQFEKQFFIWALITLIPTSICFISFLLYKK